jgi:hypothetical protein
MTVCYSQTNPILALHPQTPNLFWQSILRAYIYFALPFQPIFCQDTYIQLPKQPPPKRDLRAVAKLHRENVALVAWRPDVLYRTQGRVLELPNQKEYDG